MIWHHYPKKHRLPLHNKLSYVRRRGAGLWSGISAGLKGIGSIASMTLGPEIGAPIIGAATIGDVVDKSKK